MNVSFCILGQLFKRMQITHCKNCNHLLADSYQFCPYCSQKKDQHRFTVAHLVHEFFHAFTHADKGIIYLVKQLAIKPGVVLREYIIEGKRKKYFNPFTFLLIVLGFTVFMNTYLKPITQEIKPILSEKVKQLSVEKQQQYLKRVEKSIQVNQFFEKKSNWVTFCSIPVISFVFWIMFKKKKMYFAEHLIAYVLMIGFILLFTTITITPLMSVTKGTVYYFVLVVINLLLQLLYFGWGYVGLLNLTSRKEVFKAYFTSFLGILLWSILSASAVRLYLSLD